MHYAYCVCVCGGGSFLAGRLEHWLQLMLRWSPQARGKDTKQLPKESLTDDTKFEEKSKKSEEGGTDSQTGSTTCFEDLNRILDLKVVLPSCFHDEDNISVDILT